MGKHTLHQPTFFLAHSTRREFTFAGLEAFGPRVIEVGVARIAALQEPRAAASTTTALSAAVSGALGAYGACWRCSDGCDWR